MAAVFQSALGLHQQGHLERAELLYKELLSTQPAHFDSLLFLGHLYLESGRTQLAIDTLGRAAAINPDHPVVQFNLGMAFFKLLRYADAITRFDKAIQLKPDYAEAFNNRGSAQQNLNQHENAIASFDQAILLQPDSEFAHNNRGISLQRLGQHDGAIASFNRAIQLCDCNGATHNNRGISLLYLGMYDEAISEFNRAIELVPGYFEAHINRGIVLPCLGRHEDALASFDRALAIRPDNGLAHNNRGMALVQLGRYADAVTSFNRSLELIPNYYEAFNNLGLALPYLGRHQDAIASYRQALKIQPDNATAHYNVGLCLLQIGEFSQGCKEFEWRWKTDQYKIAMRDFPQPLWLGLESPSLLGKTILLHAEQGLGDTIQFSRYAKLVAARGARVLLEVQSALKSTLASVEGVSQIIGKGEQLPEFDVHCPLLSLPLALHTELQTIPADAHYLSSDPERRNTWQARLGDKSRPRVGLVWSGNTGFGNDHNRSIPLASFAKLNSSSIQFISLQKEVRATDRPVLDARKDITQFSDELHDFSDTAALIDVLDCVISVDTAVAHLAGALGKPVWLLLPCNPDWRWLLERNDSPWYPTARLFRQPRHGDWDSVIEKLAEELGKNFATE